jgi:hypothetical protein
MQLRQVREYHAYMQVKDANMAIMAFTRPTNELKWYTRGWVVSGYAGYDSHKYFTNKEKATAFIMSRLSKENRE